jgi:hypothetical protein
MWMPATGQLPTNRVRRRTGSSAPIPAVWDPGGFNGSDQSARLSQAGLLFDHLVGAQLTIPAQLWPAGLSRLRNTDASAALIDRDVSGGDLVFVGSEGCQDFGLLGLRDLEEVQSPSEFCCDLIEFCRGDPEVPVGLLKAERRRAGLGGRELEGPTRNVADPQHLSYASLIASITER